nr:hypothetical protein [uncultured Desulfobacter sp.]
MPELSLRRGIGPKMPMWWWWRMPESSIWSRWRWWRPLSKSFMRRRWVGRTNARKN